MAGVAVERRTAVIEYGTAECRLGYAGPSNMPAAVVPTLIGRARGVELTATEKAEAAMAALAGIKRSKASIWVGDDLFQKAATLDVSCPITAGRITDWVRSAAE